jgi:hypothetical protein
MALKPEGYRRRSVASVSWGAEVLEVFRSGATPNESFWFRILREQSDVVDPPDAVSPLDAAEELPAG